MKIGICCVYFYGDDGEWLLPLQLQFIAETLSGYCYTIYAAANRLAPELRAVLRATPNVTIVELPHIEERANSEHAIYLDKLLQFAYTDGCTHLAALDSDSLPIANDWPKHLLTKMNGQFRFTAVLRTENDDTALPHPCGYFMTRDFYEERHPTLLPDQKRRAEPRFQEFLLTTHQRVDTGIGYGYELWKNSERWLPLLRSNKFNFHFLMAGIYGEIFFHLGSSSRRPSFYLDYRSHISLRVAERLRDIPVAWRLAEMIEGNYLMKNELIYKSITAKLKHDPKSFFSNLLGSQGQSITPKNLPR
jgi:hypothetical protein